MTSARPAVLAEIPVMIDYGQLVVFVPSVPRAGLLWTDEHVRQGFAWAPGIVCFGISDHDGYDLVRIEAAGDQAIAPEALWAIRVPLEVQRDGVEVGTVGIHENVSVPEGRYSLVFQALPGTGMPDDEASGAPCAHILHLKFCPVEIVKQGSELQTDKVLRISADYA